MKDERLAMMSEANKLTDEIASLQTDIRLLLQLALLLHTASTTTTTTSTTTTTHY